MGLVCPACQRMLRLPAEGDLIPPPVVPQTQKAEVSIPKPGESRRKRHYPRGQGEGVAESSWDRKSDVVGRTTGQGLILWVGGGVLAAVALVLLLWRPGHPKEAPSTVPVVPSPLAVAQKPAVKEPAQVRDVPSFTAAAKPVAQKFLEAQTAEDLLPVVSNPSLVGPKMRGYYQAKPLRAEGLDAFAVDDMVGFNGRIAVVQVRTRALDQKQMCMVETPDGWRVDWESWVGWSEMSWPAFLAEKPKRAALFRVVLRETQYYNYAFADEQRWKSYRLESPDGEHAVFGYVERGGGLDKRIRPAESSAHDPFILMLRFPPDADTTNQVIIDQVIAEGWVENADKSKP